MAGKNTAVFGIYKTALQAEEAASELSSAGFASDSVSALLPDNEATRRQFAHEKNTKAPEGSATGAVAGGFVGGALGLLAGIGSLAIPGLGPLIAAGPIVATLAGAGAGGAVGTFVGSLVGMGIPEYEAKRYEGSVKDGGILLSVHCNSSEEVKLAKEIMERTGGQDIASAGETSTGTYRKENDREVPPNVGTRRTA